MTYTGATVLDVRAVERMHASAHWRALVLALALGCVCTCTTRLDAQVPGELRGQVTDAISALPIPDALIELPGRAEATRSDANGHFTLCGLEPRSYTVRVRTIGYRQHEMEVEVTNGRVAAVDIRLVPSSTTLAPTVVTAAPDTQRLDATTFDRAAIERSGKRDLGELLQSAPGVVVTQEGGPGSASRVSLRGSGPKEVLVLLDGVALNSPITGEADLSRVALEGIESITVRTGAQSARYGGRALAGIIDIRSRRSSRDLSALLRAGAWGEMEGSVSIGGSRPLGAMRAGGSLTADYRTLEGDFPYDVPDVRGGGTARRFNAGVTSRQLQGVLSLDGAAGRIAARGSWEELSRGLAGSIIQPSITGRERQLRRGVGLDAAWRVGALSWTVNGGATRERSTFEDHDPPFGTRYDDTVTATALTASTELALGGSTLGASLGGEARSLDITSTMLAPGAPRRQRLLAMFGGLRAARRLGGSGTRVGIALSGRLDHSSLGDESTLSSRIVASISHRLLAASVSLGSGYAPPSLADQFFNEGVLVRPNPGLRAERTRGDLEARLKLHEWEVGPASISAEAAVYRADIDGMILWLPDFRFVWSPANFAVHRSGWELSGRVALPLLAADLRATVGRADVEYNGAVLSGQVAYRPRTTAKLAVGAGRGHARIEVANSYVGERRTVPGSELNALRPYWRTDLRLTSAWPWGSWRLEGSLAVDNILDRPAAMLADYPFPARGWTVALRVRRASGASVP